MARQACIVVLVAMTATACALATERPGVTAGSVQANGYPASVPSARQYPAVGSGDALAVDVYPRMMFARDLAWIRIRIEPDSRVRGVYLEWESDTGAGGAHLIDLEGDAAPTRVEFPLRRVEAGEYEIVATLMRSDGTRVTRAATMKVFSR